MKNSEKYSSLIEPFIVIAIVLIYIVSSAIQCVAETGMSIEVIRSGKVPVEASYD